MSKVRIPVNPKQVGRVGAYSMYVRAGEQIVRQRQNASNYGDTASRTYAQQLRRVMWSNLVNQFRVISFWQPRAYENIRAGQTDYNKFMSLNVNAATLPLTKQMASDGATIVTPVIVSQGSLPSPVTIANASVGAFEMGLAGDQTTTILTVGDFSAVVMANNPNFLAGDALCFVGLRNWSDLSGVPRAACEYVEVVLDAADTTPLAQIAPTFTLEWVSQRNAFTFGWGGAASQPVVAGVCIHTRRNVSALAVSTEKLVMLDTSIMDEYSGENWLQECIDSYGTSTQVPLEPGMGGDLFKIQAAVRSFSMSGANFYALVDKDGKVFANADGNVVLYVDTGDDYEMSAFNVLPADVQAWGNHNATYDRADGFTELTTDGAIFSFPEALDHWGAPDYPTMRNYVSRRAAQ